MDETNGGRKYDMGESRPGSGNARAAQGGLRFKQTGGGTRHETVPKRENKRAPVGGKAGYVDADRHESMGEKSDEFNSMYKNFMDAIDDTCYRDMPKTWLSGCSDLYSKSDKLVEMYLHDYDDWAICNEVQPACKSAKMFGGR